MNETQQGFFVLEFVCSPQDYGRDERARCRATFEWVAVLGKNSALRRVPGTLEILERFSLNGKGGS